MPHQLRANPGLIPLPPPPVSIMNGTALVPTAAATAAVVESRSVSEDSTNGSDGGADLMIEEILKLQAEYLEGLPRHLLSYELAKAKALMALRLP